MEDIEIKVLEEIKEAWPYMSKEDKMYWLGKIEGIRDAMKLMNHETDQERKEADNDEARKG